MKKLIILLVLFFFCASAFGISNKPMLGQQIDGSNLLSKGIVGLWWMNEGVGNKIYDLSGNGNTGSFIADTYFVPGKFGSALNFDGAGDYVNCGTNSSLRFTTRAFTVVYWYYPRVNTLMYIAGNDDVGGGYSCSHQTSARIQFITRGTTDSFTESPTNVVPLNQWNHVACVYTGTDGDRIIYANGKHIITESFTGSITAVGASDPFHFGERPGAANSFDGIIDHAMIYNYALSASEIDRLYSNPFGIVKPTFYPMLYSAFTPSGVALPGIMNIYRRRR